MRHRHLLIAGALGLAAAAGLWWARRAPPRGLHRRVPPDSLTFPAAVRQRTPLRRVRAFPRLTFRRPLFLAAAPDGTDRIFVVEQAGRILVFPNRDDVARAEVFLDLSPRVSRAGNEEGLLGLAFAPDYAASGLFYVYYSAADPRRSVLSRFRVTQDANRADPASERVLLEIPQPYANHTGGMLAFGPDGMLYAGVGDGGAGGDPYDNGQDRKTLLGAILRIDPSRGEPYAVPADNPFFGEGRGVRAEIWAFGLRNPWRFSFDAEGRLWVGDVGQGRREEIDIVTRGGNYGWRIYEGTERYSQWRIWRGLGAGELIPPVHEYEHDPVASVTGGYVYRGTRVPSLAGAYVYGDFVTGAVWALRLDAGGGVASNRRVAQVPSVASFGEDQAGELYAVSLGGSIYRFAEAAEDGPGLPFPVRLSDTGLFFDTAALRPTRGLIEYGLNAPSFHDGARAKRWIAVPGGGRIRFAPTGPWDFPAGTVLVMHLDLADADSVRRLETRVLVRQAEGWGTYAYKWNEAQDDAFLLDERVTEEIEVGRRRQAWTFLADLDCVACHSEAAGFVLGVRTRQLNRPWRYGGTTQNQLEAWNGIGLFTEDIGAAGGYGAYVDPHGAAPTSVRARTYLAVNCAVCHRPGGSAPVEMDLRYDTALEDRKILEVAPQERRADLGAVIVRPGAHRESVLWRSMEAGEKRMPPLPFHHRDARGLALIGAWIDGLRDTRSTTRPRGG